MELESAFNPPSVIQRGWLEIRVLPFVVAKILQAPFELLVARVGGTRSDGLVFMTSATIPMAAIRGEIPWKVPDIAARMIDTALLGLATYRDCECTGERKCAVHSDNENREMKESSVVQ